MAFDKNLHPYRWSGSLARSSQGVSRPRHYISSLLIIAGLGTADEHRLLDQRSLLSALTFQKISIPDGGRVARVIFSRVSRPHLPISSLLVIAGLDMATENHRRLLDQRSSSSYGGRVARAIFARVSRPHCFITGLGMPLVSIRHFVATQPAVNSTTAAISRPVCIIQPRNIEQDVGFHFNHINLPTLTERSGQGFFRQRQFVCSIANLQSWTLNFYWSV